MNSHLSFKHLHIATDLSEGKNIDEINQIIDHSSSLSSKEILHNDKKGSFQITKSHMQINAKTKTTNSNININKGNLLPTYQNSKTSCSPITKLDKKLKESILAIINMKKASSLYYLKNIRNCTLKWIKEGENGESDYNKFITEKKIKYLVKHLETTNTKLKIIAFELEQHKFKIEEINKQLGELYQNYDYKELKEDIQREENSYDVKVAKKEKAIEQLEIKKSKLSLVKIQNQLKYIIDHKTVEKNNLSKNFNCTKNDLKAILNYFKSIK